MQRIWNTQFAQLANISSQPLTTYSEFILTLSLATQEEKLSLLDVNMSQGISLLPVKNSLLFKHRK